MKKQFTPTGKLSLKNELTKSELKQVLGGYTGSQTYCSGGWAGPFPAPGSSQIGCQEGYCSATGHGTFLYCA
jgi:hypothetical protein